MPISLAAPVPMTHYNSYYNNPGSNGRVRDDDVYSRKRRNGDSNRRPSRHQPFSSSHDHKRRRHSSSRSREWTPRKEDWDDDEHHYIIHLGESLTPRYKILDIMGEGTFGKVVECWDRELKRYVAVKIIRAIEKYRDAAMIEIDVLDELRKNDPQYKQPCIQLLSWFEFRGHVCMVFQKYGLSIYDFLKKNSYKPFMLQDLKSMAYQLLHSVAFLHSLTLIHTDLKPENILFVNSDAVTVNDSPADSPSSRSSFESFKVPKSTELKLIDFGSATFDSHYHTTVVSTRHYRAPEVLLGILIFSPHAFTHNAII
jgi:dual-specificity kinase